MLSLKVLKPQMANLCGQKFSCKARAVELATLQRCAGHLTSRVDITEAYQVGGTAVSAAFAGETGEMVILKRVSSDPYICTTDLYDVDKIANVEKKAPKKAAPTPEEVLSRGIVQQPLSLLLYLT